MLHVQPTFVRFIVGTGNDNLYLMTGIITIAKDLRDSGKLQAYEVEWLNELFEWFNEHLPRPPFQANLDSGAWTRDAVAWYFCTAESFINRMWDIAAILRENGVAVRFVQTENSGKIVYQDDFQVVAETPPEMFS